jgi:hypothetical protein
LLLPLFTDTLVCRIQLKPRGALPIETVPQQTLSDSFEALCDHLASVARLLILWFVVFS